MQEAGPQVALGRGGFADDVAPADSLVAMRDGAGEWIVAGSVTEARRLAGKVQGRKSTIGLRWPIELPAGDWARRARVGDRAEVALTPARVDVPDATTTLVLAGDTTAFPAITTWLESVPAEVETRVFVEEDHADRDLLPRVDRARGTWEWVSRDGARGAALARAIRSSVAPHGGMYAWAAGEKTLVKNVREVVRDHLALDRRRQFSQFYWIEGKATG